MFGLTRYPMADRAHFLARTLVSRMANLEEVLREDANSRSESAARRTQLVEKVLAVEVGVTDGTLVALVESALPRKIGAEPVPDRDVARFADFLRERLGAQLTDD
jgi:hypothetical protein